MPMVNKVANLLTGFAHADADQQRCERVKKEDLKAVGEKTIYADIQRCTDEILRLDKEIFRAREQLAESALLVAIVEYLRAPVLLRLDPLCRV